MGLEEILTRIKAESEEQYSKILSDAKTQADRIIQEAREQAQVRASQIRAQAEREAQEERQRAIAAARLESKRQILQAREKVISRYENEASKIIDEFVKSRDYKQFLFRMIKDGVNKIGEDALVQVNQRDYEFLKTDPENSSSYNISESTIDTKGGALISSLDGKKRVNNTIESILSDRREELRLKLSETLFRKEK